MSASSTISLDQNPPAEAGSAARDGADHLATALLQSLMRPMSEQFAPRLFGTMVLTFFSLGILPLILISGRLRRFAARERDQLWHLAEWMRGQFGADADRLDMGRASDALMKVLRLISWCGAIAALAAIVVYVAGPGWIDDLMRATFGYVRTTWHTPEDERLWMAWSISLGIGYTAHWLAVLVHQMRMRSFVESFNDLATQKGMRPITPPTVIMGLGPLWLIGAFLLMSFGALWGIPLALAGSAQTRYIRYQSRMVRSELAQRVRDVLSVTRPALSIPVPVILRRKCPTQNCQAPLPPLAVFCPRCGMRVAAVDRVA